MIQDQRDSQDGSGDLSAVHPAEFPSVEPEDMERILVVNPDGFSKVVEVAKDAMSWEREGPTSVVTYAPTGDVDSRGYRVFERVRERVVR